MAFRGRAVAALTVVAVLCTACGSDDDGSSGGTGDSGDSGDSGEAAAPAGGECTEERVGGSLTVGAYSEPAGLDPIVASGAGVAGGMEMAALYDTLMRYDAESGEFEPNVAESLEPNGDHTEWTLTLPDGLTFGDGDPFTAEAVKASIERHSSDENRTPSRNDVSSIAEMTVVDPLTLRFTLTEPWASFPYLLADKTGMITNPAAVESAGEAFSTAPPPEAGVGAYELVRYAPGEEIVMRAKADYWDGPVCIEELRFVTLEGAQATYDAFQTDEVQVAFLRQPQTIAQAQADGVAGISNFMSAGATLLINQGASDDSPPTADERVRQAIAAAIDPEVLNERVYEGTGHPTRALVSEESRFDPGVEGPEVDPDRAAELVEEVKEETGWDGSLDMVCQNDPINEEVCITLQAMLDAAGFDVTTDLAPVTDVIRRITVDRDFDIATWGVPGSDEALWRALSQFRSDAVNNRVGYADPDMDAALDELKAAASPEEQNAALGQIQEIWNETIPSVTLSAVEEFVGVSERVGGLRTTAATTVLFDDAYLSE
jgi:peptide/nickel transport system substrate-binding protein